MRSKFVRSILGGIFATVAMTVIMFIAGAMGLREMNPPEMLANMMGISVLAGWGIHLMIGVIFALIYSYGFLSLVNGLLGRRARGVLFGIAAFLIAWLAITIIGSLTGKMPGAEGNMIVMAISSLVGHIIFGTVLAQFIRIPESAEKLAV